MGYDNLLAGAFAFGSDLTGARAYLAILTALLISGLGVPIPEDITLFAAGFLAYQDRISLPGAFLVGFFGVLAADTFLYLIGRHFGRRVFGWSLFRRLFTPERILKAEGRIRRNARIICFTARFMPGLRAPVYLMAGILRVPWPVFFGMDALAALISVPVWVFLAYYLGDELELLLSIAHRTKIGVVSLLVLCVGVFLIRRWWKRHRAV
jgi:membrane protein DedA with SNARE-associated domain